MKQQLARLKPGRKAPGPGVGYTVPTDLSFVETVQAHLTSTKRPDLACLRFPGAIELAEQHAGYFEDACKTVTELPESVQTRMRRGADKTYVAIRQLSHSFEKLTGYEKPQIGPFKFVDSLVANGPHNQIRSVVQDLVRDMKTSLDAQEMATIQSDPSLWAADKDRLKQSLGTICHRFKLFGKELQSTLPLLEEDALQNLDDLEKVIRFGWGTTPEQKSEQKVAEQLQTLHWTLGSHWSDKTEAYECEFHFLRRDMHPKTRAEFDNVNIINAIKVGLAAEVQDIYSAKYLMESAERYYTDMSNVSSNPSMHQMLEVVKSATQEGTTGGRQGTALADHVFQKVVDWYVAGSWKPQSTASGSATAGPSTAGPSSRPAIAV